MLRILAVSALALASAALATAQSSAPQLYRVAEFPVRIEAGNQIGAAVSGPWVAWHGGDADQKRISGRNLETGLDFTITAAGGVLGLDVADNVIVTSELGDGPAPDLSGYGVFAYQVPGGQRFEIAPFGAGRSSTISAPARTDGKTVVWLEEPAGGGFQVRAFDLASRRSSVLSTGPAAKISPAVSGNIVVWLDRRNASPTAPEADIFGYNLSTGHEFRVTSTPAVISAPEVSGDRVVWSRGQDIFAYSVATAQRTIARMPAPPGEGGPHVDGDIVVWSAPGDSGSDLFGYDLKEGKLFTVSRAIGDQTSPRLSGKTVVWTDYRRSGAGRNERDADVFGARLEAGPAPAPSAVGVPETVDARIEIVWPHGGAPVSASDRANISAWLFFPGTLKLAPCQWSPAVQLWRAENNEPAKLVATGRKYGDVHHANGRGIPSWEFNDIDVSAARDSNNKLYFYVSLDGMTARTNVWAHGADARTFFPTQDVPGGVTPAGGAVDAKIQIVWPHGDAPVDQARLVNITTTVFAPGTQLSVPPDYSRTVRLYRSLNNEVGQPVAMGQRRLINSLRGQYPVWDFNDIDVSAANDLVNKYHFTIAVEGVRTATTVWVHGADARTYFPKVDTPEGDCRGA